MLFSWTTKFLMMAALLAGGRSLQAEEEAETKDCGWCAISAPKTFALDKPFEIKVDLKGLSGKTNLGLHLHYVKRDGSPGGYLARPASSVKPVEKDGPVSFECKISSVPDDLGGISPLAFLSPNGNWAASVKASRGPTIALDPNVLTLKIDTDNPDALYKKGEKAKFLVSVLDGKQRDVAGKRVLLEISKDGGEKPQKLAVETKGKALEVECSLDKPGFILCSGVCECEAGKKLTGFGGAGFSPSEIKPALPAPEDFKAFWDAQRAELANIPMNPAMAPVEPDARFKGKVETFDVKADCAGGTPMRGYYSRPVGAKPKSLPAFVHFQGAGVYNSSRLDERAAQGMIALGINAHGIENGKPEAFYDELAKGALNGYVAFGANDREKNYFRGMFLRVARAVEFVKSQPEWDGRRIIAYGGSQGGAQALAAAALDPQVSFCVAFVPALCDHNAEAAGGKSGWALSVKYNERGQPVDPALAKAAQYYDMANFAPMIKAKAYVVYGMVDRTCPPGGVNAMFNSLACSKEIRGYPMMGHGYSSSAKVEREAEAELQDYLKDSK